MVDFSLQVSEEAWGVLPFKAILKRDKSRTKDTAFKEMLFIYYWSDIKSDYTAMPETTRLVELKKDIDGLPKNWEMDDAIKDAIKLYSKFETLIERLYRQSYKSATDIGDYLENTKAILEERDNNGKPVTDIAKITTANGRMPKLMADLKAAYKEVIKEQEDNENKKKGSQSFNTFENGFE